MRAFLTLHTPRAAKRYYETGVWRDDTFYGLLERHVAERGDAPALRDGTRRLAWREVKAWADGVAADLAARGLVEGDRVSIWRGNAMETVIVLLACSRQGYACNPTLHRTHTCAEVATLLKRLRTAAFFTEPGWGADRADADLEALLAEIGHLKAVYPDRRIAGPGAAPEREPVTDPDKVAYLAFTSGTTGMPKCVMHSDNTLFANARDMVETWNVGPDTRLLSLSPLSHHIAWVGAAQWALSGCEFITDDRPDGVDKVDWLAETGATYAMGVPTHAMDVLAEQRTRGLDRIGSLKTFYMAGAPIPPSVCEAFVAQGIRPQNIYGMTENSSHHFTWPDDDAETVTRTCGRGGPAYEVAIFDMADPNKPVRPGVSGQIAGRGGALMLGYFANQEATEESFNETGWFLSGDLGSLDGNGNLSIDGRLKDLIIRGGHNIYPSEIEALAIRHDGVERVAVFPVPDERLGEKGCIAVIGGVGPDALLSHLHAEGLSRYDMPEYFIRMDAFPLTASGKILKRELVEMARQGTIRPDPVRFDPAREAAQ
ncbi:MAG: class I adenylate-forming enzyme family protein [Defluviicoccus sp.]|nr:class I adenylate-forming enzyme family protein [Defluviicoccus sp.]MDE0278492.1 class I adenylate-forming enzyme family protein [Defluviicoccus sp.]